jgi:branched-chain amino acid transport system ATP-binding protein
LLLEAKNITKSFGGLVAVHDLDFAVHEGEILGLIGPNGAGKTTLFSLITGFLKPDSGGIYFKGKNISGHKPHKICKSGVVRTFQLVRPFSEMTAIENVMVGRIYGRKPSATLIQARIESQEILDFVGLGQKGVAVAGTLTLPERKRLELARALAGKPYLLLLDEIMAGLNPVELNAAIRLIQKIRESGITVIMVEHNVKAVMRISNRVMVISYGVKIAEGTPPEIVKNQQVIEAYLGRT